MEDWGHWDHYVQSYDPRTGLTVSERCLGLVTAEHVAEIRRQCGCWRVQIFHRRFGRRKGGKARASHRGLHRQYFGSADGY